MWRRLQCPQIRTTSSTLVVSKFCENRQRQRSESFIQSARSHWSQVILQQAPTYQPGLELRPAEQSQRSEGQPILRAGQETAQAHRQRKEEMQQIQTCSSHH